jgi:hypothetical protein
LLVHHPSMANNPFAVDRYYGHKPFTRIAQEGGV